MQAAIQQNSSIGSQNSNHPMNPKQINAAQHHPTPVDADELPFCHESMQMWQNQAPKDGTSFKVTPLFINITQLEVITQMRKSALYELVRAGLLPRPIKLSASRNRRAAARWFLPSVMDALRDLAQQQEVEWPPKVRSTESLEQRGRMCR